MKKLIKINAATNSCNIASAPIYADDYDNEDYGFGFDLNGEPIDESAVEELCRIAQETLDGCKTITKVYYPADIDCDTFKENYYATGSAWGAHLEYTIYAETTSRLFDLRKFGREHDVVKVFPALDMNDKKYEARFGFTVNVTNSEVTGVQMEVDIYEGNQYSSYYTERFSKVFDWDSICDKVAKDFESSGVLRDIHITVSNI